VLPFRSNIPRISEFSFEGVDPDYPSRARKVREAGGHAVVGGRNYGQGSSREHAALGPRYLGLRAVLARSFARIHRENLVNFGVLPLVLDDGGAYEMLETGGELHLRGLREQLGSGEPFGVEERRAGRTIRVRHDLTRRQMELILAGGLVNWMRRRLRERASSV
jgi:aconitate hydratase